MKKLGLELCFWGNITITTEILGSPEEARAGEKDAINDGQDVYLDLVLQGRRRCRNEEW